MTNAEKMVDDFKPLIPLRVVRSTDIHHAFELALRMISEEGEDRDDSGRRDVQCQFILKHGELLNKFGKALNEIGAIVMKFLSSLSVLRDRWVRRRGLDEWRRRGWK